LTTPETTVDDKASARDARSGLIVGLVCYLLWGFLPLLFHALQAVNSVTIVADRTICSLVVVGAVLLIRNRMAEVATALRDPQTLRSMIISAVLLAANWLIFIWAVAENQVLEASFGYFINPLVNVAIGMVLLGERQNPWQWAAIGVAVVAILVQAVGIGRFPWIAVSLALTFGFYGYFRKTAKVGSASGLFVETLILVPLAVGYLAYTIIRDGIGLHADPSRLSLRRDTEASAVSITVSGALPRRSSASASV
jgi:chloramphenicol-sensitive protein RarD